MQSVQVCVDQKNVDISDRHDISNDLKNEISSLIQPLKAPQSGMQYPAMLLGAFVTLLVLQRGSEGSIYSTILTGLILVAYLVQSYNV